MDEPHADTPPPPDEASARPVNATAAGCMFAFCLALLPALYVGSFAFLIANAHYEWGFLDLRNQRLGAALETFYWPLLVLYLAVTDA